VNSYPDKGCATVALLAEYTQLKTEQAQRIGVRDNLMYATLASVAAVVVGTQQTAAGTALLLALPAVCVVLGWTYLSNDRMVTAIGAYVRRELAPALAGRGASRPAFGWEDDHGADRRRHQRKRIQLAVDLGTYCGPGLVGIAVHWSTTSTPQPALLAATAAGLVATAALGWQFVVYREA
jgi:hypothetical protein